MKQAVLISINPKWCELIASGKKTIEVRKTKPKLLPPFKCYIYCTKMDDPIKYHGWTGYVIGEFICDWCDPFQPRRADFAELSLGSLVPPRELYEYAKGKTLYGWHITGLKLYAEPMELTDFMKPCVSKEDPDTYPLCLQCKRLVEAYGCGGEIIRAPQSWQYVEDLE